MGIFAAMLVPSKKSCEGCDYGNKPINLLFQSRKVIEIHLALLVVLFALKKSFYIKYLYLHLVTVLVASVINRFRKIVLFVAVILKIRSP